MISLASIGCFVCRSVTDPWTPHHIGSSSGEMKSWRGVHRWSEEDDEVEKKGAVRLECAAESVAASSCRLRDALIISTLCRLPPGDMSPVGQTPEASRRRRRQSLTVAAAAAVCAVLLCRWSPCLPLCPVLALAKSLIIMMAYEVLRE
jgi:hypothetical protein